MRVLGEYENQIVFSVDEEGDEEGDERELGSNKRKHSFNFFGKKVDEKDEVELWKGEEIEFGDCPLTWWKVNENKYPT